MSNDGNSNSNKSQFFITVTESFIFIINNILICLIHIYFNNIIINNINIIKI